MIDRSANVAEREFTTSDLQMVHARWHPGSSTSTHIVVLTSDNVIRFVCVHLLLWRAQIRDVQKSFKVLESPSYPKFPVSLDVKTVLFHIRLQLKIYSVKCTVKGVPEERTI